MKAYYQLTKPGIIRGNAVHVLAGSLLASTMGIDWTALAGVLIGTSLVIASACVANNYMDRGIDAKMSRTKHRPSVTGTVSLRNASVFAGLLGAAGIGVLSMTTGPLVVAIGVVAYLLYVFAYGYAKRRSIHSTLIGAIPGALPAMAGYVAVDGRLSLAALLVFAVVFFWQMPHFYAISVFRKREYKAAGIPVMGVVRPIHILKRYVLFYMAAYSAAIACLITVGVTGLASSLLLLAGALFWVLTHFYYQDQSDERWARALFGASLILPIVLLVASIFNVFIPPVMYGTMGT